LVAIAVRVVAIDGPAGAGKSTIARALARRLGVRYLDTGAMYRAVAFAALRDEVDLDNESDVAALARGLDVHLDDATVKIDGFDATTAIRSAEVNSVVSRVATLSSVRALLREQQRAWVSANGGGVVEGRDIGTVVFPDATLKLFLTARPEVRARRRVAESGGDVDEIARSIAERDRIDSTRSDSPLAEANGAVVIDTSDLTIDEVVEQIHSMVLESEARHG